MATVMDMAMAADCGCRAVVATIKPLFPWFLSLTAIVANQSAAQSFQFVPQFDLKERYSDNAALALAPLARSDWITDLTANIHLENRSARLNGTLDYRITRAIYSKLTNLDNTQRSLNSNASLEAVEKWLFIDARATISQQNRSPFGTASPTDVSSTTPNRVETSTYQISPYIRGNFADAAMYQFRANSTQSQTSDNVVPDTRTNDFSGFVKSPPSSSIFGWSVDGNIVTIRNVIVNKREDSRVRAALTVAVNPQIHLSLSGGHEISDLGGGEKKGTATYGGGVEWSPSDRTQFAAVTQKRFFGFDHLIGFAHRTPLTAWRFTSSKEIDVLNNQLSSTRPGSVYSLLLDLLASTISDPVGRSEAAQQRIEQTGIPTSSGLQDGFLNATPYLIKRQEATVALLGVRNTIALGAGRREQSSLDGSALTPAGLGQTQQLRQDAINGAWAYRLSALSTVRLSISYMRTEDRNRAELNTVQRVQGITFSTRFGPSTTGSVGVQRIVFESTVENSYRENAFGSSFLFRF